MCNQEKINEPELSVLKIIILGLAPGLIILFLSFVFSSPFFGINFSIVLSLMMAIFFGLIPVELGILKFIAWRQNKKIKDIILYRNKQVIFYMIHMNTCLFYQMMYALRYLFTKS